MVAKAVAAFLLIFFGMVLGVVASSVLRTSSSGDPDRPANVPNSARWAGGSDGGVWVQCKAIDRGTLACQVYADVTGVLVEKGQYIFNPDTFRPTFYSADLIDAEVRFERVIQ